MTDNMKPVRCGCGGEAEVHKPTMHMFSVHCISCGVGTGRIYPTEAEAIEAWNRAMGERTGKWIEYPDCLQYEGAYSDDQIVCSACHHVFSILDNCTEEFDYCPHCGARLE